MIMICYWDKKPKKILHVRETDKIRIKKHWFDVSCLKDVFFTGCVSNDHHCAWDNFEWFCLQIRCEIHNNAIVYILSDVSQKVLRGFGLSTSGIFTLLTLSGLIRPWRAYHEPAMPTAILNFKINMVKPEIFDSNCPSQQPIKNRCWYICQ